MAPSDRSTRLPPHNFAPNAHDRDRRIALHYAAGEESAEDVRQLIDELGSDVAARDREGWTPLHFACMQGRDDTAAVLIEKGAPLNVVDRHGSTPLNRAILSARDNARLIHLLVAAGADPDFAEGGLTPRAEARMFGITDTDAFFGVSQDRS